MKQAKTETQIKWSKIIDEQRSSGLTQSVWCKNNGVSINSLQGWITRLGKQIVEKETNPPSFVALVPTSKGSQIKREEVSSPANGEIELTLIKLRLPSDYDGRSLCNLIAELSER